MRSGPEDGGGKAVVSIDEDLRTVGWRGREPVRLRPKSFKLLTVLARNAPDAVTKDLLAEKVWGGSAVSDESIARCIHDIRQALGDSAHAMVQTIPGHGYRLKAQVEGAAAVAAPARRRETVAMLPFTAPTMEVRWHHFAEGLTSVLLSELTRADLVEVLSPTLIYREGRSESEMVEAFRAQGAAYVIGGMVQGSPEESDARSLRAGAWMISAADGRMMWTHRWDAVVEDFFEVQDEIVMATISELASLWSGRMADFAEVRSGHLATSSLDAYELFQRGVILTRQFSEAAYEEAIECLRRAVAIDPGYGDAWATLSTIYGLFSTAAQGEVLEELLALRKEAAEKAYALRPRSGWALLAGAWARAQAGHLEETRSLIREAAAEARSNADLLVASAWFAALNSDMLEEAERWALRAVEMHARRPDWYYCPLGYARFFRGETEAALEALRRAPQNYAEALAFRAACEAELGLDAALADTRARLVTTFPGFSSSGYLSSEPLGTEEKRARLAAGFARAGLPA
ncbi:winged helix-turn-helix domain-containing tetratricopeptide repeat protein [Vannielia sp. SX4]|uniref:winged helix-turn-helix domain-containing tetratricopeptide repeat protein n=1 Tax=Vannielia sp. SX4 TaxID=3463852 RepID=UPI004058DA2E